MRNNISAVSIRNVRRTRNISPLIAFKKKNGFKMLCQRGKKKKSYIII